MGFAFRLAEAYDRRPASAEEGRASAAARAAAIRAHLAEAWRDAASEEALAATYEAATSLLADLWVAVADDVADAPRRVAASVAGGRRHN